MYGADVRVREEWVRRFVLVRFHGKEEGENSSLGILSHDGKLCSMIWSTVYLFLEEVSICKNAK